MLSHHLSSIPQRIVHGTIIVLCAFTTIFVFFVLVKSSFSFIDVAFARAQNAQPNPHTHVGPPLGAEDPTADLIVRDSLMLVIRETVTTLLHAEGIRITDGELQNVLTEAGVKQQSEP